jgi:hypothetical protein
MDKVKNSAEKGSISAREIPIINPSKGRKTGTDFISLISCILLNVTEIKKSLLQVSFSTFFYSL